RIDSRRALELRHHPAIDGGGLDFAHQPGEMQWTVDVGRAYAPAHAFDREPAGVDRRYREVDAGRHGDLPLPSHLVVGIPVAARVPPLAPVLAAEGTVLDQRQPVAL